MRLEALFYFFCFCVSVGRWRGERAGSLRDCPGLPVEPAMSATSGLEALFGFYYEEEYVDFYMM